MSHVFATKIKTAATVLSELFLTCAVQNKTLETLPFIGVLLLLGLLAVLHLDIIWDQSYFKNTVLKQKKNK